MDMGRWNIELLPQDINPNNWIGYRDIDIAFDSQNRTVVAYGKWVAGLGVTFMLNAGTQLLGKWRTFDTMPLSRLSSWY